MIHSLAVPDGVDERTVAAVVGVAAAAGVAVVAVAAVAAYFARVLVAAVVSSFADFGHGRCSFLHNFVPEDPTVGLWMRD